MKPPPLKRMRKPRKAPLSKIMEFQFIEYADINTELKTKLSDLAVNDEVAFLRLAKDYSSGKSDKLRRCSDIMRLAVALKAFEYSYKKYKAKNIPDPVFYDTLSDIGIWCRDDDNKGLKNYLWIQHHVAFELFKIGRLQFEILKCSNPTLNYSKLPFKRGDTVINIHIPACGKLDINECKKSLYDAVSFFKTYFPELKWEYFLCESWLVYGNNDKFMDKNSNILNFTKLFTVNYSVHDEYQTYERLYNLKHTPVFRSQIKRLPERTSLQKRAKEYRLAGNRFGIGCATIKKQAYKKPAE